MKPILITLFLLLTSIIYGQTEIAKSGTFKCVYVGLSTTQGVSYRLLKPAKYDGFDFMDNRIQPSISGRDSRETPGYALNAGLRLGINATKFFAIETGIEYARKAYKYKLTNFVFDSEWDGSKFIPSEVGDIKHEIVYHYIDIPISFNFNLGKRKVTAAIATGVYMNIFLNNVYKSETTINGERNKYNHPGYAEYTKVNISPFFGIGVNYQINDMMSLRIMPTAQFQVVKNIENPSSRITEYLYSGGINMALNFGFIDVTTKPKK